MTRKPESVISGTEPQDAPSGGQSLDGPSSRRSFLKGSAATLAAVAATGAAGHPAVSTVAKIGDDSDLGHGGFAPAGTTGRLGDAASLDPVVLRAIAKAVLPSELTDTELELAVIGFEEWASDFEPAAELRHPYLRPETLYTHADPVPGWGAQLTALDLESSKRFGRPFAALQLTERRALLEAHIGDPGPGMPAPASARHVAVALLAHFFASSEATDLCYGRNISKEHCRGLQGSRNEPSPRS